MCGAKGKSKKGCNMRKHLILVLLNDKYGNSHTIHRLDLNLTRHTDRCHKVYFYFATKSCHQLQNIFFSYISPTYTNDSFFPVFLHIYNKNKISCIKVLVPSPTVLTVYLYMPQCTLIHRYKISQYST